jgi:hypothetical protein
MLGLLLKRQFGFVFLKRQQRQLRQHLLFPAVCRANILLPCSSQSSCYGKRQSRAVKVVVKKRTKLGGRMEYIILLSQNP